MKTNTPLHFFVQEYFASLPKFSNQRYILFRDDGGVIFDSQHNDQTQSIGALAIATWQSSLTLLKIVDSRGKDDEFRMSFATSSEGIFLQSFLHLNVNFYLAILYSECINPGLLKRNAIKLKIELVDYLQKKINSSQVLNNSSSKKRKEYLFAEITDEEIEKIFGGQ